MYVRTSSLCLKIDSSFILIGIRFHFDVSRNFWGHYFWPRSSLTKAKEECSRTWSKVQPVWPTSWIKGNLELPLESWLEGLFSVLFLAASLCIGLVSANYWWSQNWQQILSKRNDTSLKDYLKKLIHQLNVENFAKVEIHARMCVEDKLI